MKINRGVIAIIFTVLFWGTSFIAIKIALLDIGPFSLSLFRFLVAYTILAPFAFRQGYRFKHNLQPQYLLLGLTGVALFYSLQNLGLMYTSAGNTAIILGGAPAVITVFAVLILKERPSMGRLLGVALTVGGIVLVSLAGINEGYGSASIIGSLFLLAAMINWGLYTVLGKRMAGKNTALVITTAGIGSGLLLLVPSALGEILLIGLPKVNLSSIMAVLYLGGVGSGMTMFLYNYALRYMDASAAAPYINLTPVVGVIFATIEGERSGVLQIAGGTVVLLGVWLSHKYMVLQRNKENLGRHPA